MNSALGLRCVDFSRQRIFWHTRWDIRDLNISKSNINEENYIPVDKDKLKEEQKAELKKAMEAYEHECLKSFSATTAGEVVKKFDFPTLQPLIEL